MSCSSNPTTKFTQFTDKSHQREAFRSQEPRQKFRTGAQGANLNAEFEQFSRGARPQPGAFEWQSAAQAQGVTHNAASPASQGDFAQHFGAGARNDNSWVQNFSELNIAPQSAQGSSQHQHQALGAFQQPHQPLAQPLAQARSFAPRFLYAEAPPAVMTQSQPELASGDFDSAFAAAEARMNAIASPMAPSIAGQALAADDMHDVARGVLDKVSNTTTSDAVAEKMRNSKFMDLMVQFSERRAVIQGGEITTSEEGSSTEPSASSWTGPKVKDVEIKKPIFEERERSQRNEAAYAPSAYEDSHVHALGSQKDTSGASAPGASAGASASKLQDPVGGQQPKEELEDYLNRIGTPEQQMPSALEAAQQLGGVPVSSADWEEDYGTW